MCVCFVIFLVLLYKVIKKIIDLWKFTKDYFRIVEECNVEEC